MDYSGNVNKPNKKKIVIVTVVMAIVVIALLVAVVVAAINKKKASEGLIANNTTFSSEVAEKVQEKKDDTKKEGAEAEKAEPVENTTENSQNMTKGKTETKDIPQTGPEDLMPLGAILGLLTTAATYGFMKKAEARE